jgi:chromosome segregation ATPase
VGNLTIVTKTGIVCAVFAFLVGCAQVQNSNDKPDKYATEIASLETVILENPGSSKSWQAHYQLAQLYLNHENPWRDYEKSLDHMQIYARHKPASATDANLQNWISVLKQLQYQSPKLAIKNQEIEQLSAELEQSKLEVHTLQQANSQLVKQKASLDSKIDILKTVDQGVEEKRENYSDD